MSLTELALTSIEDVHSKYLNRLGNSKVHSLKTWPEFFEAIVHQDPYQRKTLEIRKNDRDFKVGDILLLREFDKKLGYTGRKVYRIITHILNEEPWVPHGYVAMSIKEL